MVRLFEQAPVRIRLERHQQIDVAVRAEVLPERRAENGQLLHSPPAAEGRQVRTFEFQGRGDGHRALSVTGNDSACRPWGPPPQLNPSGGAPSTSGMSTAADPLLETLVNDFGGNYVFALDLLEQYRQDRQERRRHLAGVLRQGPRPAAGGGAATRHRHRQPGADARAGRGERPGPADARPPGRAGRGRRASARRRWRASRSCPATSSSRSAAGPCGSSRTWRRASRSPPRPPCARSRCGRSRRTGACSTSTARRRGRARSASPTSWPGPSSAPSTRSRG